MAASLLSVSRACALDDGQRLARLAPACPASRATSWRRRRSSAAATRCIARRRARRRRRAASAVRAVGLLRFRATTGGCARPAAAPRPSAPARRRREAVPPPQVAFARDEPLAGLQCGCRRVPCRVGDDADLPQAAVSSGGASTCGPAARHRRQRRIVAARRCGASARRLPRRPARRDRRRARRRAPSRSPAHAQPIDDGRQPFLARRHQQLDQRLDSRSRSWPAARRALPLASRAASPRRHDRARRSSAAIACASISAISRSSCWPASVIARASRRRARGRRSRAPAPRARPAGARAWRSGSLRSRAAASRLWRRARASAHAAWSARPGVASAASQLASRPVERGARLVLGSRRPRLRPFGQRLDLGVEPGQDLAASRDQRRPRARCRVSSCSTRASQLALTLGDALQPPSRRSPARCVRRARAAPRRASSSRSGSHALGELSASSRSACGFRLASAVATRDSASAQLASSPSTCACASVHARCSSSASWRADLVGHLLVAPRLRAPAASGSRSGCRAGPARR